MHTATPTGDGPATATPDLVEGVLTLLDDGDYAQADRLLSALLAWSPDEARLSALHRAHGELRALLADPRPERPGRLTSLRSALRATTDADRSRRTAAVELRLLGPLQVRVHGVAVSRWSSRRARSVLCALALHRRPLPAERLMDMLWPAAEPRAARNNLHGAIHALRRTLATTGPDAADLVLGRDGCYRLAPDTAVWLDVDQFDRHRADAVAAARWADPTAVLTHAEAAVALYRGPLFEDAADEDWHLDERAALQARYCDLLQTLAERHLERGAPAAAEPVARQLVALDPCREPGHRLLIRARLADGDTAGAARQYQRCVQILRTELGIGPEPRTAALLESIKGGLSGRRDASPAPAPNRRTGSARPPR